MPNWCDNKLTVTHEDKAMIDRFVNAYMNDKLLSLIHISEPTRLRRSRMPSSA